MRTETTERTLYKFDELSESAQQKAMDEYRQFVSENMDYEFVYEDAAAIGDILGIDLRTKTVTLMNGSTRLDPCIYWSGFRSQGDGACFEGSYRYAKGAAKRIREHAPLDAELHRIADRLQALQKAHFYGLKADMEHSGHYCHSGCMRVSVSHAWDDASGYDRELPEDELRELMRDFADWVYRVLESEYEYQTADEAIRDGIEANGYEFTENGSIA
jgi:hypothetical protein